MNQIMSKECSCFYFLDYVLSVHTKSNAKLNSQAKRRFCFIQKTGNSIRCSRLSAKLIFSIHLMSTNLSFVFPFMNITAVIVCLFCQLLPWKTRKKDLCKYWKSWKYYLKNVLTCAFPYISHPNTKQAQLCLASEIRGVLAHSMWYGCRLFLHPLSLSHKLFVVL